MSKTEKEYLEEIRDLMRGAEDKWNRATTLVSMIIKINMDEKRAREANEATGARAAMMAEGARMLQTHKDVTDILLENWPENTSHVAMLGGKGR